MAFALSDMRLTSSAFKHHRAIPARHSGEGENVSPDLAWSEAPADAGSFAVICHDPDAPLVSPGSYGFVHWVLYNIPGSVNKLAEGTDEYTQGKNNYDKTGYGGPMPPKGHGSHHYYFWILALDRALDLPAGLTLWELLEKIEPHVTDMSRLVGTYVRD